jgi:hypothetical protein
VNAPLTERTFHIATDQQFPTGLRCATCQRAIRHGQPYTPRPHGMTGDTTISILTCVYCEAT